MPLIKLPRELLGMKLVWNPTSKKWELPDTATEVQKKAYEEHKKNVERIQRDCIIIKDVVNKRILIKKPLIEMMASSFPDFEFVGAKGIFYGFTRTNGNGLYDHIMFQRDYYDGKGALAITEMATCFNCNWNCITGYILGHSTDIGVLLSGRNPYPAGIGWRHYDGTKESIDSALCELKTDIEKHGLPYFREKQSLLLANELMMRSNDYLKRELPMLSKDEVDSLKSWVSDYDSEYRNWLMSKGFYDGRFVSQNPRHDLLSKWINDILDANPSLRSREKEVEDFSIILFRDCHAASAEWRLP